MKLRLLICTVLLALVALPAFADSESFTNQGGELFVGSSGISANSPMTSFSINGTQIFSGNNIGFVDFNTGAFTGSLASGGTFSGALFKLGFTNQLLFRLNNFTGTLTSLGNGLYDLAGIFSGVSGSIAFNGSTNQIFSLSSDGHGDDCWHDLHGTTTITATASVPEPGTLTFFGTGLIALAGAVRRKLAGRI